MGNMMDLDQISALVADDMKAVEGEFESNLKSDVPLIPLIGRYVLLSGGKRIRPLLLILSARLSGYEGERMIPLAAIMEFIHTATLLHDDVVDNATLRRGHDSANKKWGNEASVLVGDFLFSKSFSLMTTHGDMRILRSVSGATTLMAEGEVLQLIKTCDIDINVDDYLEVVTNKTAVLLAVACEVGGLLGKRTEEEIAALYRFGLDLGMAFQLTDDCLDYVANQQEFGKSIGTDLAEGKMTLPLISILNLVNGEEKARIAEIIEKDELPDEDLNYVVGLIFKYDGIGLTKTKALEYVSRAQNALSVFPDSKYKDALLGLADYVVTRRL